MKAVFISYDQAYGDEITELLESKGQTGFTKWMDAGGRGSVSGIPHLGNHAWPAMVDAILTVVDDGMVADLMASLKQKDEESPDLGLRAFVWDIESAI